MNSAFIISFVYDSPSGREPLKISQQNYNVWLHDLIALAYLENQITRGHLLRDKWLVIELCTGRMPRVSAVVYCTAVYTNKCKRAKSIIHVGFFGSSKHSSHSIFPPDFPSRRLMKSVLSVYGRLNSCIPWWSARLI